MDNAFIHTCINIPKIVHHQVKCSKIPLQYFLFHVELEGFLFPSQSF